MRTEPVLNADDDAPEVGAFRYYDAGSTTVPQNLAGLSFRQPLLSGGLRMSLARFRPALGPAAEPVAAPVGTVISSAAPELGVLRYQPELFSGSPLREYRARRRRHDLLGLGVLGVLALAIVLPVGYLLLGHVSRGHDKQRLQVRSGAVAAQRTVARIQLPARPTVYVIRPGDVLGIVAHRHHVRLKDLLAVNHIAATTKLHIGHKLLLPAATRPALVAGAPAQPALFAATAHRSRPSDVGEPANIAHPFRSRVAVEPAAGKTAVHLHHYLVSPGQHDPALLAHRFGLSTETLLAANHLTWGDRLRPGRTLTIPPADGYYHTVQRGDTITGYLRRRHIDHATFLRYNPGVTRLHKHQVVFLPGDPPALDAPEARSRGYRRRDGRMLSHRGLLGDLGRAILESFHWPLARHDVTSPFGPRKRDFHPGIDIGAPMGTPIHAARAGVVVRAGWDGGYGKSIDINAGGGVMTRYAHASKLLVHDGERVNAGQTIGLVGQTGDATGPHLHFEVRINGRPINPMKVL